jgi:hypothetical protein
MLRTGSVSWSQGDAAELLEVEFQGIARLLNLPVGDARPGGKGAQLDVPGRPARLRVDRRRRPNVRLTHIRSSSFAVSILPCNKEAES